MLNPWYAPTHVDTSGLCAEGEGTPGTMVPLPSSGTEPSEPTVSARTSIFVSAGFQHGSGPHAPRDDFDLSDAELQDEPTDSENFDCLIPSELLDDPLHRASGTGGQGKEGASGKGGKGRGGKGMGCLGTGPVLPQGLEMIKPATWKVSLRAVRDWLHKWSVREKVPRYANFKGTDIVNRDGSGITTPYLNDALDTLFIQIRRTQKAPVFFHKALAVQVPQGKKVRTIGIFGSLSKMYYSMLWDRSTTAKAGSCEYGYVRGKSREPASLTQLGVSWRLRASSVTHINALYDQTHVFFCSSRDGHLVPQIMSEVSSNDDGQILCDRVRMSTLQFGRDTQTSVLVLPSERSPPGDSTAACIYASNVRPCYKKFLMTQQTVQFMQISPLFWGMVPPWPLMSVQHFMPMTL